MHRDKTATRILLILSVILVVVAAPAIVRQRFLDIDQDVTPASEKRGNPGDAPQDVYPVPQMDNELPTTSETSPLQNDPPPESGTTQLHNDQTQTSGSGFPMSQDNTSPASGDPQSDSGPLAGSEDPQLHEAPYPWRQQHTDWRPTGEIVQGESSSQDLYPEPQMDNDRPPASGALQLDNDPSALGTPQLDNDSPPTPGAPHLYNNRPPASGTPQLDNDRSTALGTPQLHDDPLKASEILPVHDDLPLGPGELDNPWRWLRYHRHLSDGAPSHESEAPPTNNLISDAVKKELKIWGAYAAVGGVTVGIALGIRKLIKNQFINNKAAYVLLFSPPLLSTSNRVTNILTYDPSSVNQLAGILQVVISSAVV